MLMGRAPSSVVERLQKILIVDLPALASQLSQVDITISPITSLV
jgi:hypothetical protein